jgi:predicted enzyme related to lactoylglutathione lyase
MSDPSVRGHFVWHELMTSDTQSAGDFFAKVIGWKTKAHDKSYTMFVGKSGPLAGLMTLPEDAKAMGTPPSWMTYIGTPDVDETARQAASLGGKVLRQPADIPKIGRFAILQDPQGAVFAAFTPLPGSPEPNRAPVVGSYSWHELATSDSRAALDFYRNLFGWQDTGTHDMGPEMGTYQMFGWKGATLGGMFNKPSQVPGPPFWLPYIRVEDSKKTAERISKLGGRVVNGPMEVPGGDWITQGTDRQGALFAVHSAKPVAAKKPATKAATKPAPKKVPPAKKAKRHVAKKSAKPGKGRAKPAKKSARRSQKRKSGRAR